MLVIRQCRVWAYEHIVVNSGPIPKLHAIFDRDAVADAHIVCDETMGTNIAVGADLSIRQNHDKLPDSGPLADRICLYVGKRMNVRSTSHQTCSKLPWVGEIFTKRGCT